MPRFTYTAIDVNKKTVKGTVSAESPFAARKHLRTKGLHPTDVKELSAGEQPRSLGSFFRKGNKGQVIEFTRELSTMLKAGIKLTEALSVLVQQISDPRLKNAINDVKDRVVTGESFADAIGEYHHFFDVIYVSMVRVGEVTGTLEKSLGDMATFMEKRKQVESKFITAMIYPVILILVCFAVVIFLTVSVIPKVAEQIRQAGQELPLITRLMMWVSDVLTSWRVLIVIGAVTGIVWGFKKFFSTVKGAMIRDRMVLSVPIFGNLIKQRIVARFASTLSTLIGSGLSVAESLKIVAEVTGNSIMNRAVRQARDRILSGADIATPLRESGVIEPAIAHMVAVGEKTGELETMLASISESMESNSDVVIERLSAAIEPVIILIMAILVGTIAIAALLPIIKFSAGQM